MCGCRRKPGRLWWLSTFAAGILSPDEGQRRVDNVMREKDAYIAELEETNRKLRILNQGLAISRREAAEENRTLLANLEMADGVAEMRKVQNAADRAADTMPLRVPPTWAATDSGVTKGCLHGPSKKPSIDHHK